MSAQVVNLFEFGEFAPRCLKVYDKDGVLMAFKPMVVQKRFLDTLGLRNIIVKSRQQGATTGCVAYNYHKCVTSPGFRAITMAHDLPNTISIFDRVRTFQQHMPVPPRVDRNNTRELRFPDLGSMYVVKTAGGKEGGRSGTYNSIHLSEYAFYNDETVFVGASQSANDKARITLETTPNGYNFFYKRVQKLIQGEMPGWKLLFYPWFIETGYQKSPGVPRSEWTDEERVTEKHAANHGITLSPEQVAWRRAKWAELTDESGYSKFLQEYPETLETCWMMSGRPRFDTLHLGSVLADAKKIQPLKHEFWKETLLRWTEWAQPQDGRRYVIGADCAEGKMAGDSDAAYVMDWETSKVVARLWGKADLYEYGEALVQLGKRWNNAQVGVERNLGGGGNAVIRRMQELGYSNLYRYVKGDGSVDQDPGWQTATDSRPVLVDDLAKWLKKSTAQMYADTDGLGEAMSFVIGSRGKAAAAHGANDDLVMALGITLQVRKAYVPYTGPSRISVSGGRQI